MLLSMTFAVTGAPALTAEDVRRLYVAHAPELRLTIARLAAPGMDIDDLLQEVFVVALQRLSELSRVQSTRAWLFGVAAKLTATRRRTYRLRSWLGLDSAGELASAESPSRTVEQKEASRRVQLALESLSEAKRQVFVLFELQGLPGEDIAAALQIPLKTVWSRLFYARKEFQAAVARQDAQEAFASSRGNRHG
jgi:RNA polymerase sigma-70 factor, ECF subfamily